MALLDRIIDVASSGIRRAYDDVEHEFADAVRYRIEMIERRIMNRVTSTLLIASGGIFLLMSFTYFLIEYLQLSRAVSFLIPSVLLLLAGMLLRMNR